MNNIVSNTIPTNGDCYESSLRNAKDLLDVKMEVETKGANAAVLASLYEQCGLQTGIEIVHGWVTSPGGPAAGRRIHHAWIEIGETVLETQGGTRQHESRDNYYKKYDAHPNQRYSVPDALAFATKGYGAWRGKGLDDYSSILR